MCIVKFTRLPVVTQRYSYAVNPAQATVPDHFRLSLTGSTGGSTNIHEIDNLRVCATRVNPIIEVDHYRFFHDGQGLTCGPESIRIVACRDANCTQEVAGPLRVTLSPSGWVGGVLGFGLAGLAIQGLGVPWTFAAAALSMLAAIGLVLAIRSSPATAPVVEIRAEGVAAAAQGGDAPLS